MEYSETAVKIILAAIDLINEGGTKAVTTRNISAAAGVNTAAVNYHFGSRDQLIGQVLRMTMDHLFSDMEMILGYQGLTHCERAFFLIDYLMEGASRYQGLTRSYMFDGTMNGMVREEFLEKLDGVVERLAESISHDAGTSSPDTKLALGQAVLSGISSAMLPESFEMLTGGEISSESSRLVFIAPLLDSIPGCSVNLTPEVMEEMRVLRKMAFSEEGPRI